MDKKELTNVIGFKNKFTNVELPTQEEKAADAIETEQKNNLLKSLFLIANILLVIDLVVFFFDTFKFANKFQISLMAENILLCVEHLSDKFPNSILAFMIGYITFKYGTQHMEYKKQLSTFHEKYIKLKTEIDINKKSLSNCSDINLVNELDKLSDTFVKYTNLLYEECLAFENYEITSQRIKWEQSFNTEIKDWQKIVNLRLKDIVLQNEIDLINLAECAIDNSNDEGELLFNHNKTQEKFRDEYSLLIKKVSAKIVSSMNRNSLDALDELQSFVLHSYKKNPHKFDNTFIFEKNLNEKSDKVRDLVIKSRAEIYRKSA